MIPYKERTYKKVVYSIIITWVLALTIYYIGQSDNHENQVLSNMPEIKKWSLLVKKTYSTICAIAYPAVQLVFLR